MSLHQISPDRDEQNGKPDASSASSGDIESSTFLPRSSLNLKRSSSTLRVFKVRDLLFTDMFTRKTVNGFNYITRREVL